MTEALVALNWLILAAHLFADVFGPAVSPVALTTPTSDCRPVDPVTYEILSDVCPEAQ